MLFISMNIKCFTWPNELTMKNLDYIMLIAGVRILSLFLIPPVARGFC